MRFVGIVSIVAGGIYCLSIVGIVFGWLPILMGVWLMRAGNGAQTYVTTGEVRALEDFIGNLRAHYMTIGIIFMINIAFWVLSILAYVVMVLIFGVAVFGAAAAA